jgi:hypothetical protein
MQAERMLVDVVRCRHMKLHGGFVVLEEETRDLLHLDPVGAPGSPVHADVVQAVA